MTNPIGADAPGCSWAGSDPLYRAYHDEEWGRPMADDARLFEKICLEGFQSGLSWLTILRKRPAFRAAFAGFDIDAVTAMGPLDEARLLADPGIVRHRGKIAAAIANAACAQAVRREYGSFAAYVWQFAPPPGSRPAPATLAEIPTTSPEAEALAADLRRRGFRFVGPTTAYAFMQAVGMVNDHVDGCAIRAAVDQAQRAFRRPAPERIA